MGDISRLTLSSYTSCHRTIMVFYLFRIESSASKCDFVLIYGQDVKGENSQDDADILQEERKERLLSTDSALLLHLVVELGDHVHQGDVEEHPARHRKYVDVNTLQLPQNYSWMIRVQY